MKIKEGSNKKAYWIFNGASRVGGWTTQAEAKRELKKLRKEKPTSARFIKVLGFDW